MSDNNNHPLGEAPWFHVILSTGLGTGFIPGAPGTYAAFTALLIWYGLYWLIGPGAATLVTAGLIVAVTLLGVWTSNVMERYWGPDPRTVVIDEYVGCWVPLLAAAVPGQPVATALLGLLGFGLFRIIDIFKPLGCRKIEQAVPGGWGVMLDDVLAGAYALIVVYAVRVWL